MKQTPLHALHEKLGARMVEFAGTAMPLQYPNGIITEHKHTRASAGLFDVSHMGQLQISADAQAVEALVPSDIAALAEGRQCYTVLTNETGGIIDDLMIARHGGRFLAVVNAACKDSDYQHLADALGAENVVMLEDRALLALQGPATAQVLATLECNIDDMRFLDVADKRIAGIDCVVSRSGYTGEDGVEISVASESANELAEALLACEAVEPVGLGARDSLRLEAGLCLSGTDIHAGTSPIEAGLRWLIAKRYRAETPAVANFPGAESILRELAEGPDRKRVGLKPEGRVPLRGDTDLCKDNGDVIGQVTSGSFGPSAGHPVAMGYVEAGVNAEEALFVEIRGKRHEVRICSLPFVPHRYHR